MKQKLLFVFSLTLRQTEDRRLIPARYKYPDYPEFSRVEDELGPASHLPFPDRFYSDLRKFCTSSSGLEASKTKL